MNKELIRDLAITGGIYDCICDPYDKLNNGDYYSSVMIDLERFAEKIVLECVNAVMDGTKEGDHYAQLIEQHFDNGTGGVLHFGVE
jgi:hypothetical protein